MISPGLTISRIAAAAAVNVETIRFYQRKGLLRKPRRLRGSVAVYHADDVARLQFVKAAQRLGFTLDEISSLLKLDDGAHCDEARVMAEHKLADVRAKLFDLRQMESALETIVDDCCATKGQTRCPLIAALQKEDSAQFAGPQPFSLTGCRSRQTIEVCSDTRLTNVARRRKK